ncbi:hypothetical protein [Blastopirellula marina]|uniref:Uncharacterized protein n=1 Tax=Blastopirellula marina TaxID=124 RepID=A0A2S8G6N8_9BACT|nr:hypothetical protein [Blastopirellula marina]PQO40135.1 hypothetical protein C5Y98_05885 [Blastopirellula marina]PTL45502.1 hypothetical protein C5Y97_05885 [Blastopirellula marina]
MDDTSSEGPDERKLRSEYTRADFGVEIEREWPLCAEGEDGKWHCTWTFEVAASPAAAIDFDRLGEEFTAILSGVAQQVTRCATLQYATRISSVGTSIYVHVTTLYHIVGPEYRHATIEMFKLVERHLGPIKTIEANPREIWPPWHSPTW